MAQKQTAPVIPAVIRTDVEWIDATDRYRIACEAKKLSEKLVDKRKEEMQALVGTEVKVAGAGVTVQWVDSEMTSIDRKRLQLEHPEINLAHYTITTPVRKFVTTWDEKIA